MTVINNLNDIRYDTGRNVRLAQLRKAALLSATGLAGNPALALALSVALISAPDLIRPALANPQNGQVVSGGATISESGNVLTVNQSSQNVQINWDSFSIAAGETTRFIQPSSSSVALNRVVGNDLSGIFGNLTANGQVFLINPNGVVFGAGSRVDVNALAVTTANISVSDFDSQIASGQLSFDQAALDKAASIVNEGDITVEEAGFVALVAPHVRNDGVIVANLGKVELGAAQTFTLDLHGDNLITLNLGSDPAAFDDSVVALLENGGDIHANGGIVALKAKSLGSIVKRIINTDGLIEANSIEKQDGKIVLSASGPGNVVVAGTLRANGDDAGEAGGTVSIDTDRTVVTGVIEATGNDASGGNIDITGEEVLLVGAAIDASGQDGGRVRIGGEFQGGKNLESDEIRNADNVLVDGDSEIHVDSTGDGAGGDVIVWSEKNTIFHGLASSMPGLTDGDGGLIEISSKGHLDFQGDLDIRNGEVLFDPDNIVISSAASGNDLASFGSDLTFAFGEGPATSTISATEIINVMGSSNNLILQANNDISVNQNVSVNSSGVLTLQAGRNININQTVTVDNQSGGGGLVLLANNDAATIANRLSGAGSITAASGADIVTGGIFSATMGTLSTAGNMTFQGIASGGNITIDHAAGSTSNSLLVNGSVVASNGAGVNVTSGGNILFQGSLSVGVGGDTSVDAGGLLALNGQTTINNSGLFASTGSLTVANNLTGNGSADLTLISRTGGVTLGALVNASGRSVTVAGDTGILLNANINATNLNLVADFSSDSGFLTNITERTIVADSSMGDIGSSTTGTGIVFNISNEVFMAGNRVGDNGTSLETGAWQISGGMFVHAAGDAEFTYRGTIAGNNFGSSSGLNFQVGGAASFITANNLLIGTALANSASLSMVDEDGSGNLSLTQSGSSNLNITNNLTVTHVSVNGGENTSVSLNNASNQIGGALNFVKDTTASTSGNFTNIDVDATGDLVINWIGDGNGLVANNSVNVDATNVSTIGNLSAGSFFLTASNNLTVAGNLDAGTSANLTASNGSITHVGNLVETASQQASTHLTAASDISIVGDYQVTFGEFISSNGNITQVGNITQTGGSRLDYTASNGGVTVTGNVSAAQLDVNAQSLDLGQSGEVVIGGEAVDGAWELLVSSFESVTVLDSGNGGSSPGPDDPKFLIERHTRDGTFVALGSGGGGGEDVLDQLPDDLFEPPEFDDDRGPGGEFGNDPFGDGPGGPNDGPPGGADGPGDGPPPPGGDASEESKQLVGGDEALGGGDPLLGGSGDPAGDAAADVSGQTKSDGELSDGAAKTGDQGVVETTNGVLGLFDDGGPGGDGGDAPPPGGDPGSAFSEPTTLVPGLVEYDPNPEVASSGPTGGGTPTGGDAAAGGSDAGDGGDSGSDGGDGGDGEDASGDGDGGEGDSGDGGSGDGGTSGGGESASVGVGAGGTPGIGGLDGVNEDGRLPAPFSNLGL